MGRSKSLAITAPVPQSDEEARAMIREIGDIGRQITRKQTQADDKIAKLKEALGNDTAPLTARLNALETGVQTYCAAHRERLTQGGKFKSFNFVTGEVKWRIRPPSVRITGVADVLDRLMAAGLDRFLRTKTEINKDAMLEEPEAARAIDGVRIMSGVEDFIIEPAETELAEAS